jgi:hypothetical protein
VTSPENTAAISITRLRVGKVGEVRSGLPGLGRLEAVPAISECGRVRFGVHSPAAGRADRLAMYCPIRSRTRLKTAASRASKLVNIDQPATLATSRKQIIADEPQRARSMALAENR